MYQQVSKTQYQTPISPALSQADQPTTPGAEGPVLCALRQYLYFDSLASVVVINSGCPEDNNNSKKTKTAYKNGKDITGEFNMKRWKHDIYSTPLKSLLLTEEQMTRDQKC